MSSICIIPAKLNSKRIKNKNLKSFLGKPILYYAIEEAKKSNIFEEIIVSSESKIVKKKIERFNISFHLRSKKLAKDNTPTFKVIRDVLKQKYFGKKNLKVCCIYPTSVFCNKKLLIQAKALLKKKNSFVFSAIKYDHPIFRSFKKKKNDEIKMMHPKYEKTPTQKLPTFYFDGAQFYFGWYNSWLKNKSIFNKNSKFIELKSSHTNDIDTLEDWKLAEIKYKYANKIR